MAVPVLNLNLAPQPSLWRQQHLLLGWSALALGSLSLATTLGITWHAYHQAGRAGRDAVSLTEETRRASRQGLDLQTTLQAIDATKEQARWKLAEHILLERSLPWSRLMAELERCMVPDMRLRSVQRVRGSAQQVIMKLKGEARTVAAEEAFIRTLSGAPVFEQVILEREAERQGGGWDFELTLPVVPVPPPFVQDAPSHAAASQTPAAKTPVQASAPRPPAPARPTPVPAVAPPQLHPPTQPSERRAAPMVRPAPTDRRFPPIRQRPSHSDEGGLP
jgi:hypothetical protein